MSNQTTDEAAVDIVLKLRNDDDLYTRDVAASMIETLHAQLTAATRRAEQADTFERAIATTLDIHDRSVADWAREVMARTGGIPAYEDPAGIRYLRERLTTIRSAASGEQG